MGNAQAGERSLQSIPSIGDTETHLLKPYIPPIGDGKCGTRRPATLIDTDFAGQEVSKESTIYWNLLKAAPRSPQKHPKSP